MSETGSKICERECFLVTEAMSPVVALKIIQVLFNPGIVLGSIPLFADVKTGDVVDPWLLSGRVVIVVGFAANVPPEPFHGFIDVVGWPRSRGAELESLAQERFSSRRDLSFFAEIVEHRICGAPQIIDRGHLTVIIFNIEPYGQVLISTESIGFFHT